MPPTFHPDIAVIIPVYNAIQYLDECLNSIVSQTYRELEIILVDDGSTDGSEKVCDQWSAKDNRISVIHQSNSGEAAARNTGISHAHSGLIAWVDSDDTIETSYIEHLYNTKKNHAASIAIANPRSKQSIKQDGEYVYSGQHDIIRAWLYNEIPSYMWSSLVNKSLYDGLQFESFRVRADALMMGKLCTRASRIVVYSDNGYQYREHADSTSHSASSPSVNLNSWMESGEKEYEYFSSFFPNFRKQASYHIMHELVVVYFCIKQLPDGREKKLLCHTLQKLMARHLPHLPWAHLGAKRFREMLAGLKAFILLTVYLMKHSRNYR